MSVNGKLTDEEMAECRALKALFESRKKELKLTQESVGATMGISQSAVGHYLHGRNALNLQAAVKFANILQVAVGQFSQRLARELLLYSSTPLNEKDSKFYADVAGAMKNASVYPVRELDTGSNEIREPGLNFAPTKVRKIPVKSLAQIINREQGSAEVSAPDTLPDRTVAYALVNDSMEGPGRKYIPRDSTLYIVEGATPEPGKVVLASLNGSEVIGEYSLFAGKPHLRPYNTQYPAVDISEAKIAGVLAGYYCAI